MSTTYRKCPNCFSESIRLKELLFGDSRCSTCSRTVGVHRVASAFASFVISSVAIITTVIVYLELDLYAALLWFTLPVGALSYVKVRFLPLATRPVDDTSGDTEHASHRPG